MNLYTSFEIYIITTLTSVDSVGAAIPVVPEPLIQILKAPGKMFIPVGGVGENQYIYEIAKDSKGKITHDQKFGVSYVPLSDAGYYYSRGDRLVE